jgi:hypothetical protein
MLRGDGDGFVLNDFSFPQVIEMNDVIETITIEIPWRFLFIALQPEALPNVSLMNCGYVLLPYRLTRAVGAMRSDQTDGWRVFDVGIEWIRDNRKELDHPDLLGSIGETEPLNPADIIETDL